MTADDNDALFNRPIFLNNLTASGISEEQARAHAKAVEDALQDDNHIALFAAVMMNHRAHLAALRPRRRPPVVIEVLLKVMVAKSVPLSRDHQGP